MAYLHADHLGSLSVVTTFSDPVVVSRQAFTPWGDRRSGDLPQTTLDYTGQKRDGTGLLYYHSRYYDPALGRFVSADTIVPNTDAALTPLTVDFHESMFAGTVGAENRLLLYLGVLHTPTVHRGAVDPQALNRYSYVQNNPLRYTDPSGHLRYERQGDVHVGYETHVLPPDAKKYPGDPDGLQYYDGKGTPVYRDAESGVAYKVTQLEDGRTNKQRLFRVWVGNRSKYCYEGETQCDNFRDYNDAFWGTLQDRVGEEFWEIVGSCIVGLRATCVAEALKEAGPAIASILVELGDSYVRDLQAAIDTFRDDIQSAGRPQPHRKNCYEVAC